MNQKGFAPIILPVGILVFVVVVGGAFYLGQKSSLASTPTPLPTVFHNTPLGIPTAPPSPMPSASSYPNGTKVCNSNADCGSNQYCVVSGPLRPGVNEKHCWDKNGAVPN